MITYRLRGLINLHVILSALVASAWLVFYAESTQLLPWIDLSPTVNRLPLLACVFAGMVLSGRYVAQTGSRFHRLLWVDAVRLSFRQVTTVALIVFAFIVATKDKSISRLFVATYLAQLGVLLLAINSILPRYLARVAFHRSHMLPTLFIGPQAALKRLEGWIQAREELGIQPMGFLTDEPVAPEAAAFVPHLGKVAALRRVLQEFTVSQVILLDVSGDPQANERVVEACQEEGCRLLIHNNIRDNFPVPITPLIEDGHAFYSLQQEPLEDPVNRLLKRALDIVIALPVVAIALPPLTIWVWLMQRLQAPGPVFFVRARGGKNGEPFQMLKFRSMYCAEHNASAEAVQARKDDDRIYPFGRFLRKSSLDEFPQFVNVLLGTMSIVGPRPHLQQHDEEFARQARTYRSRALVKPGITGMAQVNGFRGEITDPSLLHRRLGFDLAYITHWSIWLDVQIIFKTAWHVLFPPRAAY